jgi:hypothetical protein
VGFALSPLSSDKLVIRGGYGLFFGRTPAIMLGTAHSQNGIQVINLTFTGAAIPAFPNRFSAIPTGVNALPSNIYVFAPDYVSPYTEQWSFGTEYQLSKDFSLNVTYLGVKGTHLSRTRDINLLPPVQTTIKDDAGQTLSFSRFPGRLLSHFGRISQFESTGNSRYNGLTIQINKRFAHSFQLLGAYTLSRAIDDNPDATSVVPGNAGDDAKIVDNPLDIRADRGLAINDVRNRFVMSGIWNVGDYAKGVDSRVMRAILSDWSVSGIFTAEAGRPFSAKVGGDLNNDGNRFSDRVPGFKRDSFTGPEFISFDPRITRDIRFGERARLQLIAEAFNVFNRANFTGVNTTLYNLVGSGATASLARNVSFGLPTTTTDPRIIQIAAKIIF